MGCDYAMLFFAFFLSQALATPRVLPEIFYATQVEQARHCSTAEAQTISHWSTLMGQQFDEELNRLELRGLKQDVYRNQLVTLSYLNLFEQSGSLMGYVYANASHHLGRLVRDAYWSELTSSEARELARADRALIRGATLGRVADVFPRTLSSRLMFHSVQLYKTLSWSLAADALCGRDFVLRLLDTDSRGSLPGLAVSRYPHHIQLLKTAYASNDFTRDFVAFEQSFLHYTMYQDFLVGVAAKAHILDPMRFISFNGEKQLAFDEWCQQTNCKNTSADLQARTFFDQTAIAQEWQRTQAERAVLSERLQNTQMLAVARVLLEHLE
jgi:hypothetical protein